MTMRIIGLIWQDATIEFRRLRMRLLLFFILTIIGVLPSVFGLLWSSFFFSFPIFVFSCYRLIDLKQYFKLHVLGEVVDLIPFKGREENTIDNDIARFVRGLLVNLVLAQLLIFLFAPVYLRYFPHALLLFLPIAMFLIAFAILAGRTAITLYRFFAGAGLLACILLIVNFAFPQIGYQMGVGRVANKLMPASVARELKSIDELRKEQRDKKALEAIKKLHEWQEEEKNLGKEPPQEMVEAVEKFYSLGSAGKESPDDGKAVAIKLNLAQQEAKRLRKSNSSLQREKDTQKAELEGKISARDATIASLEKQVATQSATIGDLRAEVAQAQAAQRTAEQAQKTAEEEVEFYKGSAWEWKDRFQRLCKK